MVLPAEEAAPLLSTGALLEGGRHLQHDVEEGIKNLYSHQETETSKDLFLRLQITGTGRELMFLRVAGEGGYDLKYLAQDPSKLHGENFVRLIEFGNDGDVTVFCGARIVVPTNARTGSEFLLVAGHDGELETFGVLRPGD